MQNEVKTSYAVSQVLIKIITDSGISPEDIQRAVGIRPSQIKNPDTWIPMKAFVRLWQTAINLTGDPALALHLRKQTGMKMVHFVVQLMMHSSNFLEALSHLSRYAGLMSDTDRFELSDHGELLEIVYVNTASDYQIRWLPEHNFSLGMELGKILTGDRYITPEAVFFEHSDPGYKTEYEAIFRSPITFEAARNSVLLNKKKLMRPIPDRDSYLRGIFKNYAEASLRKKENMPPIQAQVIEHISAALPSGKANIKDIASKMNMNRTTLYRQLKKENETFQSLLAQIRRKSAIGYLKKDLSISQICYLLGFSEPAAFNRAFKKWTGMNPGEYRKTWEKNIR